MGSFLKTYGLGFLAVIIAVLVRWLLDPLMGDTLPLVTLFGAVAAAVWLGGYRLVRGYGNPGYIIPQRWSSYDKDLRNYTATQAPALWRAQCRET